MRYYVYSIEYGFPPNNPYHEDDDFETCTMIADNISSSAKVCAYVVDRENRTQFAERYVAISDDFKKVYNETRERIKEMEKRNKRNED